MIYQTRPKPLYFSTSIFALIYCLSYQASAVDGEDDSVSHSRPPATSEESIDIVSEGTVEDALARRPDLKFGTVQIDGQKSSASLDSISATAVESLDALKVPTPNMDADTTNGALSIKFKPRYSSDSEVKRVTWNSVWKERTDNLGHQMSLTYGKGIKDRFGYLFTINASDEYHANEIIDRDWDINDQGRFLPEEIELESRVERDKIINFNGTSDFKINDQFSAFVRADAQRGRYPDRFYRIEYELENAVFADITDTSASVSEARVNRSLTSRDGTGTEYSASVGLQYEQASWDWKLVFSHNADDSDRRESPSGRFSYNNAEFSYRDIQSDLSTVTFDREELLNASNYKFDEAWRSRFTSDESSNIVSFDLVKETQFNAAVPVVFSSGFKINDKEKSNSNNFNYYDSSDLEFDLSEVAGGWRNSDFLNGEYDFSLFHDPSLFAAFFEQNPDAFVFDVSRSRSQSDASFYNVDEKISSAYLMADGRFNQWRSIIGIRVEQTEDNFLANEVTFDDTGEYLSTRLNTGSNRYTNYFPGVHLAYTVSDRLSIFSSYTTAIKRPNYSDLVPSRFINENDQRIEEGNPLLKPLTYTVIELSADWQYSEEGFSSIELFSQSRENIIVDSKEQIVDGPFQGWELYKTVNGAEGKLQKAKLRFSQGLGDISKLLDPLRFDLSWVKTRSESTALRDGLPLPNIPEDEVKSTLAYQTENLQIRLKHSYRSNTLRRVGDDATRDTYRESATYFDLVMEYQLANKLQVLMEVKNLTQEGNGYYYGEKSRPGYYSYRGRAVELGLRKVL